MRWMRCSQAFPPGEPVTSQGRWGLLAVDEGYVGNVYPHPGFANPLPGEGCSRLPPEEPVTSQGRWGPLAVDEVLTSLPPGGRGTACGG